MREILFRGKRKDNGEWIEGDLLHDRFILSNEKICRIYNEESKLTHREDVVIPETVGQYTGMTDKNGKRIFEGDIIRTITFGFDKEMFVTEIKFGSKSGVQGFYLSNGRSMFYFGQTDLSVMSDTEVIGNIHDNPELLKGEEENA